MLFTASFTKLAWSGHSNTSSARGNPPQSEVPATTYTCCSLFLGWPPATRLSRSRKYPTWLGPLVFSFGIFCLDGIINGTPRWFSVPPLTCQFPPLACLPSFTTSTSPCRH